MHLFGGFLTHCASFDLQALETLAKELIGRSVLVGWPHLFEAFVVAVSDDETRQVTPHQITL